VSPPTPYYVPANTPHHPPATPSPPPKVSRSAPQQLHQQPPTTHPATPPQPSHQSVPATTAAIVIAQPALVRLVDSTNPHYSSVKPINNTKAVSAGGFSVGWLTSRSAFSWDFWDGLTLVVPSGLRREVVRWLYSCSNWGLFRRTEESTGGSIVVGFCYFIADARKWEVLASVPL
jgi:hypothetical protein